jgi:hypothetical protein
VEDRVRELERDISSLRVANAELAKSVEHLSASVRALTDTVSTLRDTMNQGKGALWLGVLAAGSVGALITTVLKKIFLGGVTP